ncbi:MAG TPA: ABC transporter permease [Candidatus Solibacter sp.]|nr:ABC transporter permease [Candidatus Solibacter sp.]
MRPPDDLRYAFRALWKDPGFTIPALLALALSIGANATVFTVVKSVLLDPLKLKRPEELVAIHSMRPDGQRYPFALPFYRDLRERARVFQDIAAQGSWNANLSGEANPERLLGVRATGNFFQMLGVEAAVGRTILPDDALPQSPKVVVFTWNLWQRRYGGRRDVVGATVHLNGEPYTVIGVLPASFSFRSATNEFAVPLVIETDPFRDNRTSTAFLRVFGRMKPGVTIAQASGDLDRIAADLRREYPNATGGVVTYAPLPMREDLVEGSRQTLTTLMWAVALVLLIACTNVSSLLVAKASARGREMAVRAALGGTRWRMARQFLLESFLLSATGGILGIALARWGVTLLVWLSPAELPRSAEVQLDAGVLWCAGLAALLSSIFLGIFPAFQVSPRNLSDSLRGVGRAATSGRSRSRMRSALVIAEVALSLVLLTGAGLTLKSFRRMVDLDPGFRPQGLYTMRLALPGTRYRTPESIATFHDALRARIQALPGVTETGAISILPMSGPLAAVDFTIVGFPPVTEKERPTTNYRMIDATYFRAMGTPIVRGRDFNDHDTRQSPPVVIASEALAKSYWKDRDPVGTHILVIDNMGKPRDAEVVGVSRGMRETGLDQPVTNSLFVPISQIPAGVSRFLTNNFFWAMRMKPSSVKLLRREIAAVDADVAMSDSSMDAYIEKALARQRFSLRILAAFAIAAMLLAGSGLYALIAYSTAQRTREMGIRLAMGARLTDIAGLVVRQALGLSTAGVILGTAAAWAAARLIAPMLVEVNPHDGVTLVTAGVAMVGLAAAASYLPARRAVRVDPAVALRNE